MESGPLTSACADYLGEYLGKIRKCVQPLDEAQVWWRPNEGSNSVGNLLLHLTGCLSQWVLTSLAGEPDQRDRASEFASEGAVSRDELLARLTRMVERSQAVIRGLSESDLGRPHRVRTYDTTGLGIVLHMVEHTSYHTGQIAFIAKQLLGGRAIDLER